MALKLNLQLKTSLLKYAEAFVFLNLHEKKYSRLPSSLIESKFGDVFVNQASQILNILKNQTTDNRLSVLQSLIPDINRELNPLLDLVAEDEVPLFVSFINDCYEKFISALELVGFLEKHQLTVKVHLIAKTRRISAKVYYIPF